MPNANVNHIVINGVTKLDLRSDTVDAAHLASGYTAHDKSGTLITGTATSGVDGDNLAYGGAYVGTAIVGSAVLTN